MAKRKLKAPYVIFFGGLQTAFVDRGEAISHFAHLVKDAQDKGDGSARGMLDNDNSGERLALYRGEGYKIEWGEGVDRP